MRDESCGWQGQQGQIVDSAECQAEDFGFHPMAVGTLSAALILFSAHTGHHQCCNPQVELLLSFMVFFTSFPFGGRPFLGIRCDNGTRLETGQVGEGPEPLGLPTSRQETDGRAFSVRRPPSRPLRAKADLLLSMGFRVLGPGSDSQREARGPFAALAA